MTERDTLLQSLAETIADYRTGEVLKPTPDHVEKWVNQFDRRVQLPILRELDHVLKQTYLPRAAVEEFLSDVAASKELAGKEPRSYWKSVALLDIQQGGNSQRDMLKMFSEVLGSKFGLDLADCSGSSGTYVYLDDGIYSGNRVLRDIRPWIQSDAPDGALLNVIVIALHLGGQY